MVYSVSRLGTEFPNIKPANVLFESQSGLDCHIEFQNITISLYSSISNMLEPSQIKHRLLNMMSIKETSEAEFQALAMDVFRFQFTSNLPYQKYCQTLESSPENVKHWHDIPRISTDVFKATSYPLSTHQCTEFKHTFLTSGTTGEVRGEHHFPSLDLYEKAILQTWLQLSLPDPAILIILTPHPSHAPHSSLSHMMGVLAEHYSDAEIIYATSADGTMDLEKITQLADQPHPVAMLGTAIAFLYLFENITLSLPPGSFAMETGGYKGTKRHMAKEDLYALFKEKLALPLESVINEYSMTELSSQFYTRDLHSPHTEPPWTRTRVINPHTGKDAANGEPGHLAIYDLANLYSVSALQTQDIAIAEENGCFTLLGRDPTALPRGCSRAADHALG